ncbi:MAG: hypothetical protein D6800_13475 [Candidatus Zixiibacteriota bacterium]|nr:MAG: hypothetical protein D6800_13475 [candidate division Zixibacteria bacterium]
MYYIYEFDGLTLPAGHEDDNSAEAAGDFLALFAGQYDANGSEQTYHRGMQVSKKLYVTGDTAADVVSTLNSLRGKVGKRGTLRRRWVDGSTEQWCTARLLRFDASKTPENNLHQEITLTWSIISPLWYSQSQTVSAVDLITSPQTISVTNSGNAPVLNAVITVAMPSVLPVDITSLTVSMTGKSELVYSGTLTAGDTLEIDCGARSVKLNGADSYSNVSFGSNHAISEWLRLEPGSNSIIISVSPDNLPGDVAQGTVTGMMIPLTWYDTLAVDEVQITVSFYNAWR